MTDYECDGKVRPTIKNCNGVTYTTSVRGVGGVLLPNNLSKKEYDEYVNERAGEVKTYNMTDEVCPFCGMPNVQKEESHNYCERCGALVPEK